MKVKLLILLHLLALVLIGSFLYPPTRVAWDFLDEAFFTTLNSTLEERPIWQLFWSLANHRLTDWVEDLIFITFFFVAVRRAPSEERVKKAAQFLFSILFAALVIYFVNRLLFRETLEIPRESPSLVFTSCVRLSDEIPWMKIKDYSNVSFPADHATTLILFAVTYWIYAGKRLGTLAIFYALFRILPRLIAGAHWFSDVVVGGGTIALITLSWAFCTPLQGWATQRIERGLSALLGRPRQRGAALE